MNFFRRMYDFFANMVQSLTPADQDSELNLTHAAISEQPEISMIDLQSSLEELNLRSAEQLQILTTNIQTMLEESRLRLAEQFHEPIIIQPIHLAEIESDNQRLERLLPRLAEHYQHIHDPLFFRPAFDQQWQQWQWQWQQEQWQWQQEQPQQWWQQQRQQTTNQELAIPAEMRNADKLEPYPHITIPDDFICGISLEIMTNPVFDPACPQQKYDLLVIRLWLEQQPTHPLTRTPLSLQNLQYDESLKEQIDNFVNQALLQQAAPSRV